MSLFELNKGDNFIFGVDVSGSMQATDCPGGASRIDFLKEKTIAFAKEASKWDEDGIDVIAFGHAVTVHPNVTAEKAEQIIGALKANEMSTDTAGLVKKAYELHKKGNYEQTVLFIATDGVPNDANALKQVIRSIAAEVKDAREFKISFLTVGILTAETEAFLTDIDDNLKATHDIVDRKALQDVDFMEAFAGALND